MNLCKMKWHCGIASTMLVTLSCLARPAGALLLSGTGADDLTTAYRQVINVDMSSFNHTPNLNLALKRLDELAKQDPTNGMLHYIRATVYAKKLNWSAVTKELKAGNAAAKCYEYQLTGPLEINLYPGLGHLRSMVSNSAKAAPGIDFAEGLALLSELQKMGTRICRTQPAESVCPLAGITMRTIAERALADLYQKQGKPADAAQMRTRQQADAAWRKSAGALVAAQSPYDWDKNTKALALKHGISQSEYAGWSNGGQTEAAKQRFVVFKKDADAKGHALTKKLLKSLPK